MDEKIILVLAVLAVLFFGGKKIEGMSRSAGRALGEFKKGKKEAEEELKNLNKKSKSK